jgi:hypothetical protein
MPRSASRPSTSASGTVPPAPSRRERSCGRRLRRRDVGLVERVDAEPRASSATACIQRSASAQSVPDRPGQRDEHRDAPHRERLVPAWTQRDDDRTFGRDHVVAAPDDDGQHADAVLPARLGDELLDPGAEPVPARRDEQVQRVAPDCADALASTVASRAGPVPPTGRRPTARQRVAAARNPSTSSPSMRCGEQAERRERRVAAADVGSP